ncbi:hypothetical protein ACSQ67_006045 [Phaseolus vulgaris]
MNFLMRSTTHVYSDREKPSSTTATTPTKSPTPTTPEPRSDGASSLESLIAEDPYIQVGHFDGEVDGENGAVPFTSKNDASVLAMHLDVSEDEGWITIPYKEIPEDWNHASDMQFFRSLDRSFLFPGEQVQILACLSACKQDMEIITPFKVAAVMSKSGMCHSHDKVNGNVENRNDSVSREEQLNTSKEEKKDLEKVKTNHPADAYAGESLLRMEVHKRQTALLLQKFENSHFFARIADADEPLWSKRGSSEKSNSFEQNGQRISSFDIKETAKNTSSISAVIDRANFDATISSGVARNSVKCCALPNGDIVITDLIHFPVWKDPGSFTGMGSTSQRSNVSPSSSSQLFSFSGHFRSYSMSSLPQNTNPPTAPVKAASSKPNFDIEDWDQCSSQKFLRKKGGVEELLSFRGVSLERERFSVCCGLEGIYTPGRRWRRKFEIIQPLEIHSFAADCNSEDLLCVRIKLLFLLTFHKFCSPECCSCTCFRYCDIYRCHYNSFRRGYKSGPPSSLPIACIEAGNDHSLPNLALRRGEEHSFILKPATSMWKNIKAQDEGSQFSKLQSPNSSSRSSLSSKSPDRTKIVSSDNQYAIMVSCRCNYTASRLFFKQATSWRPRTSRDIIISVASEISGESPGPYERNSQLPVQVLTLQASNLTSEDLTLTVLAPASFTSPPSVVSLSSPTSPNSPFIGFTEFLGRINVSMNDDVIPSSGLSCTHLWLHSRVPLGCIPSQSTATIKLELLPLTDGIIALDSLQIDVMEKGVTYIPERSLKINATSSISKGII